MQHNNTDKKDTLQEKQHKTTELTCTDCGKRFIFRACDYERFANRGWSAPKRCPSCRKAIRKAKEAEQEAAENAKWQKIKAENQAEFERQLKSWNVVSYADVRAVSDKTLYIIGNGFDMMHGANSSYYCFRDSLGKDNSLRQNLETFTTVDDVWADFENALAHIDMSFFFSRLNIDNWLYISGAYEEDTGAAEFYMAVGDAVSTVTDMVDNLKRRFFDWVSKLSIGTADRPLMGMFCSDCKVLNFNYTEFVETMYNVPRNNICYIHGCRQKEKGKRRPDLILGHAPNASDDEFNKRDRTYADMRNRKRREMIYVAQETALRYLIDSDTQITKDCRKIIEAHDDFFKCISSTEVIVTIGHSLSEVDWPYFNEIISRLHDQSAAQWYIGCHGLRDLENLKRMIKKFNIAPNQINVFRTDVISVRKNLAVTAVKSHSPHPKLRCKSADGRWLGQTINRDIRIIDSETGANIYTTEFPANISNVFFLNQKLVLVSNDYPSGIFVFGMVDDHWVLLFEMEKSYDANFIKRSLDRILLDEGKLIFVYNNRVRVHSFENGELIHTAQFKGAKKREYPGEDVTTLFVKYR